MPIPHVSVIVPCYNEEATIRLLLDALYVQSYPRAWMEVIFADGMSSDRTREVIAAFASEHPDLRVKVVDNPQRIIPAGLNRAIQAACGETIVRMDAHSMPNPDYLRRCMEALEAGSGDNVGGIWEIRPANRSWIARSIAIAAAHPLGVGDARYRLGGPPQKVDTVPFGAFRRSLLERIGFFDETLLTNEDYEFNVRVRQSGGVVWLDPAIRSQYFARSNLAALFRQYWRYGFWKARMLRRYPHTLRWRQLLPPLFVLSLLLLSLLTAFFPRMGWLLMVELSAYLIVILTTGIHAAAKNRDLALIAGLPLAIATMHLAWGGAFLWSLIKLKFKSERL
jgi:glycosyltransferase involved in cell wall biosynthesis